MRWRPNGTAEVDKLRRMCCTCVVQHQLNARRQEDDAHSLRLRLKLGVVQWPEDDSVVVLETNILKAKFGLCKQGSGPLGSGIRACT